MKVLLLDDEIDCLNDLYTALSPTKYELIMSSNPLEVLDKYNKENIDVVITDVGMDELSGIDLLRELKKKNSKIRVIVMTAYADVETAKKSINNKATAFFTKPVNIDELIEALRDIEIELDNENKIYNELNYLKHENFEYKEKYEKLLEHENRIITSTQNDFFNIADDVQNVEKNIILRLSEIAEIRSKETGNHIKRVAEYSELLGIKSGLSRKDVEILKFATPMHDVGKVAISDDILNKKGSLTKEEFEQVKLHTIIGHEILTGSNQDILKTASLVAYEHHEKFDGSGYPRGLFGKNISAFGRIVAIADVFDALSSDRCYKKAWDIEKIVELLINERDKHFESSLVDIFLDNLNDFLKIKNKYADIFELIT